MRIFGNTYGSTTFHIANYTTKATREPAVCFAASGRTWRKYRALNYCTTYTQGPITYLRTTKITGVHTAKLCGKLGFCFPTSADN